jgi:Stress responsive A/B Barrel Domain
MFRHVVLFTWTPEATQEQQDALASELRKLPAAVDSIRAYHTGPDAGVNQGNFDFAVVAEFDDADGYRTYRDHPAHRAVIEQYLNPIVARRAAVQYEI